MCTIGGRSINAAMIQTYILGCRTHCTGQVRLIFFVFIFLPAMIKKNIRFMLLHGFAKALQDILTNHVLNSISSSSLIKHNDMIIHLNPPFFICQMCQKSLIFWNHIYYEYAHRRRRKKDLYVYENRELIT